MNHAKRLYPAAFNPLFHRPERPLPDAIGVVGAGTIGPDIGYYLKSALPGSALILVDLAEPPLLAAEKRFANYAWKAVQRGRMPQEKADRILENIRYTTDYRCLEGCQLVIEAASERIPLKREIFARIEEIVSPGAVITSNTSSIPANRIFSELRRPERATVTHFFAPAWRNPAVEVIRWEKADPETVAYLCWLFAMTGKAPVVTDNVICFMLDRVFDNWCNEAALLLPRATAAQIDGIAEEFASAGPFFVLNLANGNPIIVEANTLQMEEGTHYRPASILQSVERWNTPRPGSGPDVPADVRRMVRDRLLGVLFSQAFDIIDRGIGTKEDLHFGCQVALDFKKGPFDFLADQGEAEAGRIMKRFEAERPGFPRATEPFPLYLDYNRYLLIDDVDEVKVITIRRPQARNALNLSIMKEILAVLKRYTRDPAVKGFVLTGYGPTVFSAGADIGRFREVLGRFDASIAYAHEWAEVQRFLDRMDKPVVAAVNGMALGGGLELAIRCHAMVATRNAFFQFPEITLGILPGIGGCIVPYRKWPQSAARFHDMLCLATPLSAEEAFGAAIVTSLSVDYAALIQDAAAAAKALQGRIPRIPDGKIALPPFNLPDEPRSGPLRLSREALSVMIETIEAGAAATTFEAALEAGYRGFGQIACLDAAREGISAFLEKRKPVYER